VENNRFPQTVTFLIRGSFVGQFHQVTVCFRDCSNHPIILLLNASDPKKPRESSGFGSRVIGRDLRPSVEEMGMTEGDRFELEVCGDFKIALRVVSSEIGAALVECPPVRTNKLRMALKLGNTRMVGS
jgi:hypothetical protein